MKRTTLLRHMRRHGCILKRESRGCDLWVNAVGGQMAAVTKQEVVSDRLASIICGFLNIPRIPLTFF